MKKLAYKLLPCVFFSVALNSSVAGHKLVYATIQKVTGASDSSMLKASSNTARTIVKFHAE
jgi:hypothetical protein